MRRSMGFALIIIALTACHRLSTAESQLLGTWSYSSMDATSYYVFSRDHTFVVWIPSPDEKDAIWLKLEWGTWRIEGTELVLESHFNYGPDETPPPKESGRVKIRKITREAFILDPNTEFRREAKLPHLTKRSSQPLAGALSHFLV